MAAEIETGFQNALTILEARARDAGYATPPIRVSLGGCCTAIGTDRSGAFRRRAHAHNYTRKDPEHYGWICVLSPNLARLVTPTGRPTALFAHEYAHIVAANTGHTERWRKTVVALGFPSEAKRYGR